MASGFICEAAPSALECSVCRKTFPTPIGVRKRKTCSKSCADQRRKSLNRSYKRDGRYKGYKPPLRHRICQNCGSSFNARSSKIKNCKACVFGPLNAKGHASRSANAKSRLARVCQHCAAAFVMKRIGKSYEGKFCSQTCLSRSRILDSFGPKLRRRLRMRAARIESVDPIKVFDRDNWQCQLCGVKTPKSLRGKHKSNSPELDHIHPLSAGGAHSYVNTQCLCRKCNGAKGNALIGQLRMFG